LSAEPSRKIAFTFFYFSHVIFLILKRKRQFFCEAMPLGGTTAGRSVRSFQKFLLK